jgi:acetolactate synthase I/II/III large subunit
VHLIWIDGSCDMVRFQQMVKNGRASGVEFGPVDVVQFAEAFGARGLRSNRPIGSERHFGRPSKCKARF